MTETTADSFTLSLPSDLEIRSTRLFDAPRELVFAAWTEPEHVREWWGQKGSTLTVCEIDLRPGGRWRYVEMAADGNEYPFQGEFSEVVAPVRLVHTFVFDVVPFNARPAMVTVTFEQEGSLTRVTELMRFETQEDRDEMVRSGMEDGAKQSYQRLDELLRGLRG